VGRLSAFGNDDSLTGGTSMVKDAAPVLCEFRDADDSSDDKLAALIDVHVKLLYLRKRLFIRYLDILYKLVFNQLEIAT
jgi:hypothetical protein